MSRIDAAPILLSLGFILDVDFRVSQTVPGAVTITWLSGAAQPSEATLNAVVWNPALEAAWQAQQQSAQFGYGSGVRLKADLPNSTTTLASVPDLGFGLLPNRHYAFVYEGAFTAAAVTTGLQIGLTGPASPLFFAWVGRVDESSTVARSGAFGAYDTPILGTASAGATPLTWRMTGSISTNSAGGILVPRFRSEIAASAVTLKRGCIGLLTPVAP